jgi:hypothetical protein
MEDLEKCRIAVIEKGDKNSQRLKESHKMAMHESTQPMTKEMNVLTTRLRQ